MKELRLLTGKKKLYIKDERYIFEINLEKLEAFKILKSVCDGGFRNNLDLKLTPYGLISIAELSYEMKGTWDQKLNIHDLISDYIEAVHNL